MGNKKDHRESNTGTSTGSKGSSASPQMKRKPFEEKGVMAPFLIPMSRRMETLVVYLWTLMLPISVIVICVVTGMTLAGIVYVRYFESDIIHTLFTIWCMGIGGYLFHVSIDRRWERDGARGNRRLETKVGRYLSRKFHSYFPGNLVFDHDEETNGDDQAFIDKYLVGEKYMSNFDRQEPTNDPYVPRSLLFCSHPHGLFSFCVWQGFIVSYGKFYDMIRTCRQPINKNLSPEDKEKAESVPLRKRPRMFHVVVHTLTSNFLVPVWREFLMLVGMCGVSRSTLLHRLTPRPQEVYEGTQPPPVRISVLVPGGAAEAVDCCENILTLKDRKGFIRVALESGAALVPLFSFGETSLYRPLINPSMGKRILHKVQKFLHLGTPLVVGRGMFNYKVGLLPHRVPLTTIVGKPVELTRKKKGTYTNAEVDAIHAEYVANLTSMYKRYVDKYGGPNAPKELILR